MNINTPTEDEMRQLILEVEQETGANFSQNAELSREDFVSVFYQSLKLFFEEFPIEGYSPLSIFTETGVEVQNLSTVDIIEAANGIIYFDVKVFRDDGTWVFNSFIDFNSFFVTFTLMSYQLIIEAKKNNVFKSDEEIKESFINHTVNVLRVALRRLPKWIEIMVDSFESVIGLIWGKLIYESIKETHNVIGLNFPQIKFNAYRQNYVRKIEMKIREFLQDDTGFDKYLLNQKKKLLALQFRTIYPHWETMQKLQIDGGNWKRYVQADDMADITDDLVDDFTKGNSIGDIAIEHAARRAELYNSGKLTKKNQELRKKGIMCSGYGRSKLFEFKKEGEVFLNENKT